MAFTYDTSLFSENYMMLGSSRIRTLNSHNYNFKKLVCSENNLNYYEIVRFSIGGIPMMGYRLSNGGVALRVIDGTAISGLSGDFISNTANTVLNGSNVQVAANDRNEFALKFQKLSDLTSLPSSRLNQTMRTTNFSGIDWQLDEENSLVVNTTTEQPDDFAKFMFGNKLLLCGLLRDGWSPIAFIDEEPDVINTGLLVYLDAANIESYPGSGNTWYDISGNNRNVTLYNTPTFSSSNGGILTFTRNNLEYGESASALPDLNRWTAEAWVKFNTVPSGSNVTTVICGQYDLVSKLNFSIGTNLQPTNANIYAGFFNGAWRNTTTGFTPSQNVWYNITGTYDGTTIKLYVNGSQNATGNITASPQSGGKLRIARRWDDADNNSNFFLDATIPVVRIYNQALTSAEVLQNYNANKTRYGL